MLDNKKKKVKPKALGRIEFGVTEQKVSMLENGE